MSEKYRGSSWISAHNDLNKSFNDSTEVSGNIQTLYSYLKPQDIADKVIIFDLRLK